jgi:drug/metabolite transporter (DMT)-like permease
MRDQQGAALPAGWTPGLGIALTVISAATFGFSTTFSRLVYDSGGNLVAIVLLRTSVLVVVVGLLLLLLGRQLRLDRKGLLATLWMSVTSAMVSFGYQGSVAYIPVSLAALVFYTYPLLVGIIASVTRRDRMTIRKAIALLTAFTGLALVLGVGFAGLDWRGLALALIAALGMCLTVTFGGEATRGQDAVVMSVYSNSWMLLAAIGLAVTGHAAFPTTQLGMGAAAGVCIGYVVAFVSWYLALSLVRPVRLAAVFNIEPLVTLCAAWLILGERLTPLQLVGAGLVLASVFAVTISIKPRRRRDPASLAS